VSLTQIKAMAPDVGRIPVGRARRGGAGRLASPGVTKVENRITISY
jgi:hypothetical protein